MATRRRHFSGEKRRRWEKSFERSESELYRRFRFVLPSPRRKERRAENGGEKSKKGKKSKERIGREREKSEEEMLGKKERKD